MGFLSGKFSKKEKRILFSRVSFVVRITMGRLRCKIIEGKKLHDKENI